MYWLLPLAGKDGESASSYQLPAAGLEHSHLLTRI